MSGEGVVMSRRTDTLPEEGWIMEASVCQLGLSALEGVGANQEKLISLRKLWKNYILMSQRQSARTEGGSWEVGVEER